MSKVEYPKYLFHAEQGALKVADAEAHSLLGAGWFESPGEAADHAAAAAAAADAQARLEAAIEAEQKDVHATPVATILEKLEGCSVDTLEKLKGYEQANKTPRKSLLDAVDKALASLRK